MSLMRKTISRVGHQFVLQTTEQSKRMAKSQFYPQRLKPYLLAPPIIANIPRDHYPRTESDVSSSQTCDSLQEPENHQIVIVRNVCPKCPFLTVIRFAVTAVLLILKFICNIFCIVGKYTRNFINYINNYNTLE